jgi:hypothetical protein
VVTSWLAFSKRFPKKKKLLANRCSSFSTFNFQHNLFLIIYRNGRFESLR